MDDLWSGNNQFSIIYKLWILIQLYIYFFMLRELILFCLVLSCAISAKAPAPYCVAKPSLKALPLSYGEQIIHSVDNLFSGYNLDISIASDSGSFARLNKKMQLIDQFSGYFPGIISHYVQHKGNNWGKQAYILYQDMTGSIIFTYGRIVDQQHVPGADFTVIVTQDKNVQCYGAALLLDYGLAIVDCAKRQKQSIYMDNYFYYIDLTSHTVTKQVKNPMYVKYTQITKRKIMKYRDIATGYEYVLRVYPADGVNIEQRGNTYMQIFSVKDPYDIQIMKVIDRSYCHTKTLSIVDAKVYLGDIFFLDYINGLFRLDILHNTDILITGRYIKDGFNKFAVYSDDLQNQVLIALANQHAIYEIDWSNIRDPVMINKYSLMQHSHIKQLIINDLFVVVQSAANATNSTHPNYQIDYTWVFSRGSRTYTNAYSVINHNSSKVQIQFNRQSDKLLVADEGGLYLYQISQPILSLALGQQGKIGTSQNLVLMATSSDPNSKESTKCQLQIKVNFVRSDDMTIYEEDYDTTSKYSINNPGELRVNLDHYVMGPNVDYSLVNVTSEKGMPPNWINKLNQTKLTLDFGIGDVIFFHVQVVPEFGKQRLIYYVQDSRYFTHVIQCVHLWEESDSVCHEQVKIAHTAAISSFTTAFFKDDLGFNYFYIFNFKDNLKLVWIADYTRHQLLTTLSYEGHQEAEVTGLATSNGFLYVLRGAVKTIDVYRLSDCQINHRCKPDFFINADSLKPLRINYFAPVQMITDFSHPQVLFIRCKGSIIILDIDNKENIVLLDEIITTSVQNQFYRIAVNKQRMVIVSDPDIIELYTLEHIYIKNQVKFLKRLPIYGYKIQPTSDIQFSDVNHLVYINAVDQTKNISTVLIYRTNKPAAAAFYAAIPLKKLYSRPALEIQVSGFYVDFLNIKSPDGFALYRVFSVPELTIRDVEMTFQFQIQFSNTKTKLQSQQLQIQAVNYKPGFQTQPQLNKTLNTLKLDTHANFTWDDRLWFKGSILGYNFTCPQCGETSQDKVHLKQHIDPMRTLHITSYDYTQTLFGGVSVYDDLFRWRMNGTLHDIINLPDQKFLQRCTKVATAFHHELIITACQQLGRGINLYVTTTENFKPWTWGPYRSSAYDARTLQVAGDILMLVDTSFYPQYKFQKGSIFLYSLGLDDVSAQQMDELQVIDENDLVMAHGYKKDSVYIANAHLVFSGFSDVYRLYVTQVDGGLFVVDFTHHFSRRQINILTINYVDIRQLLEKFDLHLPSDASIQAVSLVTYKYNPHFYMESVIVTTKGYHNLQILLVFDDDGNIISSILHRVYFRYGDYNTVNQVRSTYGYIAVSYIIPYAQEYKTNRTRQIVAVYDSFDYDGDHQKGYSERYMLGAFRGNKTVPFVFAFNTTYDFHTNGTRIGLIVTNPYDAPSKNMYELSLGKNLTIQVRKDYKQQDIILIPYSDFDVKSFKMHLIKKDDDDDEKKFEILIIIIIVLAAIITIGFSVYLFMLIKKKKQINEERSSLITDESSRHTIEPTAGQYVPPTDTPATLIKEQQQAGQQEGSSSSEQSSESQQQEEVKAEVKVEEATPVVQIAVEQKKQQ